MPVGVELRHASAIYDVNSARRQEENAGDTGCLLLLLQTLTTTACTVIRKRWKLAYVASSSRR